MIVMSFAVIALVIGGSFVSQDAYAEDYVQYRCVVPYNIRVGDWNTGIHITANYFNSEQFTIYFSGGGQANYKAVTLNLADYPGGWTGWIQDLFNLPELVQEKQSAKGAGPSFISPSYLLIYSKKGWFTVSQFIINSISGYGYQTFHAWPVESYWPYQVPSSVEPLSKKPSWNEDFAERNILVKE
jgi:hypothetical protein